MAALIVAALFIAAGQRSAGAQPGATDWTEPYLLTPEVGESHYRPFLAADQYGGVHAIWHEGGRLAANVPGLDAVYYSFWNGMGWSEKVDILAPTGSSLSEVGGLVATPDGRLLIPHAQEGYVIISQSPVQNASAPRAWSSRRMDAGVIPAIAVSSDGTVWCLAYWDNVFTTLFLTYSRDRGETWAQSQVIWSAGTGTAGSKVQLLVAQDGRVHLVWSESAEIHNWAPEAIWHATYDLESSVFSTREVMRRQSLDDPTTDTPSIAECPNGQIHMVWNNGIGSKTGRFHQYSDAAAETWSVVSPLFPGLSGLTSKPGLVCDSTGRVHLVTAAPGLGFESAIRYATWFNGVWSDYETLWQGRYAGERPSLVIAGGNKLHVTWDAFFGNNNVPGTFIAHAYATIDAPAAARPIPTQEPTPTAISASAETPGTPTSPAEAAPPYDSVPMSSISATQWPVLLGIVPALMLLGGVILVRMLRRR